MSPVTHGQTLLQRMNTLQRCAMLATIVLLALPIAGFVAWQLGGSRAVVATVAAAAICWACSTTALLLTAYGRGQQAAMKGLLFSIFFQMGLPLMIGIALSRAGGALAEGGVFGWIVVFHLLTLTAKTVLVLPLLNPGKSPISQGA